VEKGEACVCGCVADVASGTSNDDTLVKTSTMSGWDIIHCESLSPKILIQYFAGLFLGFVQHKKQLCNTHNSTIGFRATPMSTPSATPTHPPLSQTTIEALSIARLQLKSIFYFDRRTLITKAVYHHGPRPSAKTR